jgi:hypothetical protein
MGGVHPGLEGDRLIDLRLADEFGEAEGQEAGDQAGQQAAQQQRTDHVGLSFKRKRAAGGTGSP